MSFDDLCFETFTMSFVCTVVSDNMFPTVLTMDYSDIMASLASNMLVILFIYV